MNTALTSALVALVLLGAGSSYFAEAQPGNNQNRPNPYLGLRRLILERARAKFNLPEPPIPGSPWGVAMDWEVGNAVATVIALSDGTASIYLSGGGGYIGGGQSHEQIRNAAKKAVAIAAEAVNETHGASDYPLPNSGEVTFWLLTDKGVLTASGSQQELSAHRHRLSPLGDAMQEVITQYRRIQPSPGAPPAKP